MDSIVLYNQSGQKFNVNVVRYFKDGNNKYLVFDLSEIDNNGYIQLYLAKEQEENGKVTLGNVTDSDDTETVRTRTTLTIEHSVYNALNVLQNQFLTIFDAKRIYRAFVVKMVLFAAIDKRINNLNK